MLEFRYVFLVFQRDNLVYAVNHLLIFRVKQIRPYDAFPFLRLILLVNVPVLSIAIWSLHINYHVLLEFL